MPANYNAIDLRWLWSGDYGLGPDGDFLDSSLDQIQSLEDDIMSVVQADLFDWEEYPSRAASLSEFIGEPNTRDTAKALQQRVSTALIANGVVRANDLQVRIIPIDVHRLMIIIKVLAQANAQNSLQPGRAATIAMVFDYMERGILPVDLGVLDRNFFKD